MKRSKTGTVVPAFFMTAAAAIPIGTTIQILTHVHASSTVTSVASQIPPAAAVAPPVSAPKSTATPAPGSPTQVQSTVPAPTATSAPVPTTRSFTGTLLYDSFGPVQTTIVVSARKIVDVTVTTPSDGRSMDINSQAVPLLRSETLTGQNANVNVVSGATETSDAYAQSLQAAISAARAQGALA